MAATDTLNSIQNYIKAFDFATLFREALNWDNAPATLLVVTLNDGSSYTLAPLAQKRDVTVLRCGPDANGGIPNSATRKLIDAKVTPTYHEHVIIFTDRDNTAQMWQWVKRQIGKAPAYRTQPFFAHDSGERLAQRIAALAFNLGDEDLISMLDVTKSVSRTFDVDKVTKRFYDLFKKEHTAFLAQIAGITTGEGDREWYASLMLNRLMFTYFIQGKGFLPGKDGGSDLDYLRNKLKATQAQVGVDQFHTFYREFLLKFFHDGLGTPKDKRAQQIHDLIGDIPYLNGGLFEVHAIEQANPEISIPDAAFEKVFDFFDAYTWRLDDRPTGKDDEINPDVLGYIFEKYINQKQMGAYYTKEDITGYIARNTIIPYLLESAREQDRAAFEPGGQVWRLLSDDPDAYIYEAVRRGVDADLPTEIAAGITDVAQRGPWNRRTPEDPSRYLPTETWREFVARRQRCLDLRAKLTAGEVHTVNDLITYNLDIVRFAQDAIEQCEGPDFVRAFWKGLSRVSVLDPTCGSGAFLFAALRILEPLYDACLTRMAAFVEQFDREGAPRKGGDFREILAEATDPTRHPSREYFIRKRIILNNLYGVDIMAEAVEIAKLRLFLALASQAKVGHIEPLPDIDFNIRAGNTLVGFATQQEATDAVRGRMFFPVTAEQIEEQAQDIAALLKQFRIQQMEHGGEITKAHKAEVRAKLDALGHDLDRLVAASYGIDETTYPNKGQLAYKLGTWRASHQPFHWFLEFYEIIQERGGFDVVIGNPPWKEYSAVRQTYTVLNSVVESCGNLYGLCIERVLRLRAHGQTLAEKQAKASLGRVSFIVQLPLVNSSRMAVVRNLLREESAGLWVVPFDDRPGKLFEGLQHCRSAIFVSEARAGNVSQTLYTAHYQRWASEARETLISSLEMVKIGGDTIYPDQFPKYANLVENAVFTRMIGLKEQSLGLALQRASASHFIFYQEAMQYWAKACVGLPYYAKNGTEGAPDHGRYLYVSSEPRTNALCALLNSSLFYAYFIAYGDCFHLSDTLVGGFPASAAVLDNKRLADLGGSLMTQLRSSAERKTIKTKDGAVITYDEYYGATAKPIIDEIDRVLAEHYGFTDEELDFIINYDIKYRMGAESGGEEGEDGAGEG